MQDCSKSLIVAAVTALALAFLLVFSPGLQAGEAAASPQAILSVDEFMKNTDRYRGKVSLEGVVSAVTPEQQAISLIDSGEFQTCGVTTCAQLTLPVQWRGPLPAVGDQVSIEGQAQEIKGKLMFVADKLKKVTRP
ncbi:MAG: hypothetical protein WC600_14455 [Desulfobaccales bacterium]